MPVNTDTINKSLYDVLSSRGYDPISLDSKGDPTDEIEKADVFRFTYKNEGKKGQAWVTNEANELVLYINDDFTKSPDFENFTRFIKQWAQKRLLGFKITNKDHLVNDMKKRTVMKKKEDQLNEGYHILSKKASYNDSIPNVKLIIQHTRNLEEGEQRFRNIARIFVENVNGERFLVPTTRPGLARVYARHIAEGGTPYDDKAKHITTLVEEYTKMAGFVRATRKGQFNESALTLVNEGLKHYNGLRMTLQGMTSHRGYNNYFESYTPVLNEETTDTTAINELFVQEKLDPRIQSVLPILNRLNKNITEMSEVKALESWATSVTEGDKAEQVNEMDSEGHRGHRGDEDPGTGKEKIVKPVKYSDLIASLKDVPIKKPRGSGKYDPAQDFPGVKALKKEETEQVADGSDIAKLGKKYAKAEKAEAEKQDTYSKEYPGGEKQKAADKDAFMKRFANEEAEQVDEGRGNDAAISAIINRILRSHTELLSKYGPKKVLAAVQDAAMGLDNLEEIGTSDVSAWVNNVIEYLKSGHYDHIDEDLNPAQKSVGQLGPTEKAKKISPVLGKEPKQHPFKGKLVGASESVEMTRLKTLSGIK